MLKTGKHGGTFARQFWFLTIFLILISVTGGGSRSDIQSLVFLRPISVVCCGAALWTLSREQANSQRVLLGFAAAALVLAIIHLIPLPSVIWHALPGRQLMAEIDAVARLGDVWRPIAMVPQGAWNAFYALFAPLAVLLLCIQLLPEQRLNLIAVLLCIGGFSGLLGLLQAIGPVDGPLYFYRITSNGSAVGVFTNRNHQAIMLATMFPMLAAYASTGIKSVEQSRRKLWVACAIGVALIPLILVTGSRAGLFVAILGLVFATLLYRKPSLNQPAKRQVVRFNPRYAVTAFAVLCMAAITVLMSRAATFDRLLATDQTEELRFRIWGPIARIAWLYFPFGSGAGSFVEVYQIHEPYELLNPTYLNHAHNEVLELYMTFGLPGLLLLVAALVAIARLAFSALRPATHAPEPRRPRLGLAVISIVAVGSIGDYPLRTPLLACVFVVSLIWLCTPMTPRSREWQRS
jgi:O-antigen ligase